MEIEKVHLVCFSPTHTSKQVANAIVHGMNVENIVVTDVTLKASEELLIPEMELVVMVVPVYGGHVAPLAMSRIKSIRGNNTPIVLVVVYGNRAYEEALAEFSAFAVKQGFKVVAAGTFVGEHSFSTQMFPIASGRPDKTDLKIAGQFGKHIAEKFRSASVLDDVYPVDVRTIRHPRQSLFAMLRFFRGVIKIRKNKAPALKAPITNAELCINCGICAKRCPTGAIIKGEEQYTDVEKCIRCCACVKACSKAARTFDTPYAPLLFENFSKRKEPQVLF